MSRFRLWVMWYLVFLVWQHCLQPLNQMCTLIVTSIFSSRTIRYFRSSPRIPLPIFLELIGVIYYWS